MGQKIGEGREPYKRNSEAAEQLEADLLRKAHRDAEVLLEMNANDELNMSRHSAGAEFEIVLIDDKGLPLEREPPFDEPHLVRHLEGASGETEWGGELYCWNCEGKTVPQPSGRHLLSNQHKQLTDRWQQLVNAIGFLRDVRGLPDFRAVRTGLALSARERHLDRKNFYPELRYLELDEFIHVARARQGITGCEVRLPGADGTEVVSRKEGVEYEGHMTSFQWHWRVPPDQAQTFYNASLVAMGFSMAYSVGSPRFLGHQLAVDEARLWIWRQAVLEDRTRPFLYGWMNNLDEHVKWYLENHTHGVLQALEEDPYEVRNAGRVPKFMALRLLFGTVWPMTRLCVHPSDRDVAFTIESRHWPAALTFTDEVANFAGWLGFVQHLVREYGDSLVNKIDLEKMERNLYSAAATGPEAKVFSCGGQETTARAYLLDQYLPYAEQGLRDLKFDPDEISSYLAILEHRIKTGRTAAWWIRKRAEKLERRGLSPEAVDQSIMLELAERQAQRDEIPVSKWDI